MSLASFFVDKKAGGHSLWQLGFNFIPRGCAISPTLIFSNGIRVYIARGRITPISFVMVLVKSATIPKVAITDLATPDIINSADRVKVLISS